MTYRVRNTALAAALAAAAVLLTTLYVRDVKNDAEQGSSLVSVLVAARDIVAGTPGSDAVDGHLLKPREVPRRSVVPGAISSPSRVEGLVASEKIYAGEQVTIRRFAPVTQQGVVGQLRGNMRGFQLPGNQHQLLAGTLRDGDHVDVVASIKYRVSDLNGASVGASTDRTASRIVLRDLLVLRAAEDPASGSGLSDSVSPTLSVILAITDNQAQKLFFVLKNGDWSLELRPMSKPKDSPESVETVESVLGDGLKSFQRAQLVTGRLEGGQ